MKYLFDMGEVWHVYSDIGKQWVYQRLEQVREEMLEKNGDDLPGPLGKLDELKGLEAECGKLKSGIQELEASNNILETEQAELLRKLEYNKNKAVTEREKLKKELADIKEKLTEEKERALAVQKNSFEKSYAEIQHMAEELQKEGKLWRQRYLDLSYQIAQKNNK